MLAFVLLLIAGGLLMVITLVLFICDFVAPLLCGLLAAQLALATGGGWPGAAALGGLAFALVATGLRLGAALAQTPALRLTCAAVIILPATGLAFSLAEAILWSVVPSPVWRTGLALITAMWVAAGGWRRHVAYLSGT
jgi:hypothetical protein